MSAGAPSGTTVAKSSMEPPAVTGDFDRDRRAHVDYWERCSRLLAELPVKPKRNARDQDAADTLIKAARSAREQFLSAHVERLYVDLTDGRSRFLRVEELVLAAAETVPGLVPTRREVEAEAQRDQRDKDGVEVDQGIFLAHVLARETPGLHLCHAMLLPRPESAELAVRFARDGVLDLSAARLERRGKAVHLTAENPRFLNAEDDSTLDAMEAAVDVAILDPSSEIAVMRGGTVEHPKYKGLRIFGAGINLTHLYRGNIPFLWFMRRDMGYVHKIFRGVADPALLPDDVVGWATEKPWVAAVDTFAIGGHCQLLLVMDYVLAAADAFMTLPARKEGIIPGAANLRLPRFTGDRIARQAIQYERRLACDSPEGRLICDEIVPAGELDAALERVVEGLTSSGQVSAVGNRRAFRVGTEPLDLFRRYCSAYARLQAYCHFSPGLIANLERNWDAKNRKL